MHSHTHRQLVVIFALVLFGLPVRGMAQQSSSEEMRSEVSLGFRTMTVVSAPALQADDPAHRSLLSLSTTSTSSGSRTGQVRIGQFETDASVCIGTLTKPMAMTDGAGGAGADDDHEADRVPTCTGAEIMLDEPDTVDSSSSAQTELLDARHDLWLEGTNAGWTLQVADAQDGAANAPSNVLGTIPLTHSTTELSSSTFMAEIMPAGADGGQLILRWGVHTWTSPVQFSVPRVQARARRLSGLGDDRAFEFDSAALQRASRLNTRNTATVTLPDGSNLGVVYTKDLNVEYRDFANLVSVAAGSVVRITAGAVTRLDIDVPLRFGDVLLETGNIGLRGSPGAYGVWLKRAADGWRLVFNDEPDAWGTQHNPEFDAAEVDLDYTQSNLMDEAMHDSSRALSASVVMTTPEQGRFVLVWGPHQWTADFAIER